jgi:hypothetical protein
MSSGVVGGDGLAWPPERGKRNGGEEGAFSCCCRPPKAKEVDMTARPVRIAVALLLCFILLVLRLLMLLMLLRMALVAAALVILRATAV